MGLSPQAIHDTGGSELLSAENADDLRAPCPHARRLDFIVRESYDEIYEIDQSRGLCRILHRASDASGLPETRALADMLAEAEGGRVYPEDLRQFYQIFQPSEIARRFAAGEKEITAEYRRKTGGGFQWFSMCLKPASGDGAAASMLLLLKNIDGRKRAEEAARRLQTKYFLALRASCGYICDIDVSTGHYVLSITGDDLLRQVPPQGDYERLVKWMARCAVHPDDREDWLDNMPLDRLRRVFSGGRRQFSHPCRCGSPALGWQWRSNTAVLLPGESAQGDSILIFAMDISEQKKAEGLEMSNRLLRQEIAHQKKTAARDACYRIIVEQTGAGIYEWRHDLNAPFIPVGSDHRTILASGRFYNSPKVVREYGLPDEECDFLRVLSSRGDIHPEDLENFERFRTCADGSAYRDALCRVRREEGYLWYRFTMTTMLEDGFFERMTGTVLNVDLETRSSRALELGNIRYRTVLQQTDTIEFEYDALNGQGYISPVLWERYDASPIDPDSHWRFTDLLHIFPGDDQRVRRELEEFRLSRPAHFELQCRVRDKTGSYVWCRITLDCLRDPDGGLTRLLGTIRNVDRETRAFEALKARAERDALTGIWNQETFLSAVNRLLTQENPGQPLAMLMMDIDKFKVVNEIFGMEGGNRALVLVGRVLRRLLGKGCYYARMYADVFCMVAPYGTDEDLIALMTGISAALATREFDYMLSPCFGVCRIPPDPPRSTELVEMAGYAHKAVKSQAGRQWAFYDETMRSSVIEQKQIESEMEPALRDGQFQIYLQPKYRLPGRTVEGAEALVRWLHPKKGLIPPGKFIPLFEENGFITQLDAFVWEEVCRLLRRWIDEGKTPMPVSVNVSRMHIHNHNLRDLLTGLVQKYRLPQGLLELELTESMFPDNVKSMFSMLHELQDAGFVLAMDDFGSGYSSLNMLKDMPLNVLKIDCGFFGETGGKTRGRTVVRHTVAMAHELEMRVVAEGVETESEAAFLSDTGCDTAQGFYFARPVPVQVFEGLAFPGPTSA